MNNNFDTLLRAIVPLSFLAIWAITSLLNRETKPLPARRPMPDRPLGPRPGEPTLRWGPANPVPDRESWRNSGAIGREEDIVIISPEDAQAVRQSRGRQIQASGTRRTARTKPNLGKSRRSETPSSKSGFAGVNQGVNQQIATTIGIIPLSGVDQDVSGVVSPPSSPSAGSSPILSSAGLASALANPARVREALLMNELLGPPLALRPRRTR